MYSEFPVCKIGSTKKDIHWKWIHLTPDSGFALCIMHRDKCRVPLCVYCCSCVAHNRHQSLKLFLEGVLSALRLSQYFITFEILQATSDDICPRSTSASSVHVHTHSYTRVHVYVSTRRHAAALTDTLIFNGIIHFLRRPPYNPPPVQTAPWTCQGRDVWPPLCSVFMRRVWSEKRDKSTFIHRGAHEWRGPTLLTENMTPQNTNTDGQSKNINICSFTVSIIRDI